MAGLVSYAESLGRVTGNSTSKRDDAKGYLPIDDYGLIGNLRTCALVSLDGSVDMMCFPEFDSPSIFCRMLDCKKGGHFSIMPTIETTSKQQYLPSNAILSTKFLSEEGVGTITDFFPRPDPKFSSAPLFPWLIRRADCVRGEMTYHMECFPAFDYARATHETKITCDGEDHENPTVLFSAKDAKLDLELLYVVENGETEDMPKLEFKIEDRSSVGMKGAGVVADFTLKEGQAVSFVFRSKQTTQEVHKLEPKSNVEKAVAYSMTREKLTSEFIDNLQRATTAYWFKWVTRSKYRGRYDHLVTRSAITLKLLTYEPTGAIIAAPTFSLPEDFGGTRNWDYRYVWIRDSSFAIYAFLRLGYAQEADDFMHWIEERLKNRNPDGSINIMYSIRGESDLEEIELDHLEGYRGSTPVRIGNGAADHLQLDIYGELMDSIYLYNKYGKPVSWTMWCYVRELCNWVCDNWQRDDMSIWEVRSKKQQFTYSKIMLWVALDRGMRLADKRSLPCPDFDKWRRTRDTIYEEVMTKGWNEEKQCFIQSYESPNTVDSAVLIMPLVFFISPCDPRFLSTMNQILKPPEKGGLTSNGLVFRYNHLEAEDGVGGREGSFSMCTFWLVEALSRAGKYDSKLLEKSVVMFEDMVGYSNHLALYSEEIARSGESLGNFPQAFTHMACISTAFNLDRTLK
ncbi:hypothetical protein YB2330_004245 [Saitoella coloradoensis]